MEKNIKKVYKISTAKDKVWQALINPTIIDEWGGGPSKMDSKVGTEFELWNGDIYGKNIEVISGTGHSRSGAGLGVTLRLAARDLSGGLRGFYVFILCIALGVMAIAGVGAVAASLTEGIAREGRVILGADVAFSLIPNEASAQQREFLRSQGRLSVAATLRAMARAEDGRTALVEIKAVDGGYPLYGPSGSIRISR